LAKLVGGLASRQRKVTPRR